MLPDGKHPTSECRGASWRLPFQRKATCRCLASAGKHSPSECHPQRQARTLRQPLPRTVEQPHACSISQNFVACSISRSDGSSRCQGRPLAGPRLVTNDSRQALSTGVPPAETSTHLESTPASHREAAACLFDKSELHGLRDQSELHSGFHCEDNTTCRSLVPND